MYVGGATATRRDGGTGLGVLKSLRGVRGRIVRKDAATSTLSAIAPAITSLRWQAGGRVVSAALVGGFHVRERAPGGAPAATVTTAAGHYDRPAPPAVGLRHGTPTAGAVDEMAPTLPATTRPIRRGR